MSNDWYDIPRQTKINAYTQVSEETGMAPFAVEKDWWVVQVLSAIFEMEIGKYLIFKGGTSLSKAWRLIERFSEDVDLALDRTYLGFEGKLSRTRIKKLRQETSKFISDEFTPELETRLKEKGLTDISLNYIKQKASDADPAKVEIHYPNVIEYPGYIPPRVLLELSSSSLNEPKEIRSIDSLLDEQYFESDFVEPPVDVPTAIPERTFLEKIFLLHEEFHRPQDKIRVDRLSRHLYDVFQLVKSDHAIKAINNQSLYTTIVKHRQAFYHMGGINYNLHQPQTINPVPIPEFVDAWEADYRLMQERMIYGDSPSFQVMIDTIKGFTESVINHSEWKMDVVFPEP
jgi:predicted nucleotidyltransferase component of viral defense system